MTIATCRACGLPMDGRGCPENRASRWGDEPDLEFRLTSPCHDCCVLPGGWHHEGCCVATCRTCGDQLLSCECGERAN